MDARNSREYREGIPKQLVQTRHFLARVWGFYTPSKDTWCEIRIIRPDGKAKSYWFKWEPRIGAEVTNWLKENWGRLRLYNANVYLGVLPRSNFSPNELGKNGVPKRGGKAHNVEEGLFIFVDLDYKREVDPSSLDDEIRRVLEEHGYYIVRESEDGGLEGYFKKCSGDGCKIEYVKKPGLNQFLSEVRGKLRAVGIEDASIVVDSGYGYHIYVKLQYEIDVSKWRRLQSLFIDYIGGDPHTKDPSRILRLPGTLNNRYYPYYSRYCRLVHVSTSDVDPEELLAKLEAGVHKRITKAKLATTPSASRLSNLLRPLRDSEILKVKELLKHIYRPGQRQMLCLYLAGWGAHSKIHPISIAQIIKMLHEETGDEDRLEQRLSTIPYSYKKLKLWNEDIEKELLSYLHSIGIEKPYGLTTQLSEEEVKGRGGINELLVQYFNNDEEAEAKAKRSA